MQSIPAEKVIPGTAFTVDGFRHVSEDVQAYFLSHAHSGERFTSLQLWKGPSPSADGSLRLQITTQASQRIGTGE